ncbi:hypothetical protein BKA64DRAFT_699790 [Cadophora sp. MPI-SDFR-AT-0126]|nr:hypothetical protein BKA64DRAFT_699790 [Leotiomycetes sp. MPI-SDFR-AT-0126]
MASDALLLTGRRSFSIIHTYGKFWHYLTSSPNDFKWPGTKPPECAPYISYSNNITLCYLVKFSVLMLLVPFIFSILSHFMNKDEIRSRVAHSERRLLEELLESESEEREEKPRLLNQEYHVKLLSEKRQRNSFMRCILRGKFARTTSEAGTEEARGKVTTPESKQPC